MALHNLRHYVEAHAMAQSAQYVDRNGYLLVMGCPVSSYGVFDYGAEQVGETEDDNHGPLDRIVKVYRPKEAITDPELINSLKLVPLIDEHDYLNGDPDATEDEGMAPEDKGVDGIMTDKVYFEDPWLKADLKIYSRRLQKEIRKGKKDLSLGYTSRFIYQPGVYDGQSYEYIQIMMRGNHIALVPEGRVAGARVLDGLVFDSMRFDIIPSKNISKDSAMENEELETGDNAAAEVLQAIQALLPKLKALAEGGEAAAPAEGGGEAGGAAAPAPGGEGAAPAVSAAEPANDMQAMYDELSALLPKLKAKIDGGTSAPGTPADNGAAGGEATGSEDGANEQTGDAVEGLALENGESSVAPVEAGTEDPDGKVGGKASPGPSEGEHATGDAAMKNLYADMNQREHYYGLISREVGSFDHKNMTAAEVVSYGNKKLGLNAPKGSERIALDAYFMGKKKAAPAKTINTGDSASVGTSPELEAYLRGE